MGFQGSEGVLYLSCLEFSDFWICGLVSVINSEKNNPKFLNLLPTLTSFSFPSKILIVHILEQSSCVLSSHFVLLDFLGFFKFFFSLLFQFR